MNWIRELEMSEIQRETLNEYIAEMENLNDKINRFMNRIDECIKVKDTMKRYLN